MNTSQYDSQTRKQLKRFQRSPAYQAMKQKHVAACEALQTKVKARDEAIDRLVKKLVESGVTAEEAAKLAAA